MPESEPNSPACDARRSPRGVGLAALALLAVASDPASADWRVQSGSSVSLNGGMADLRCTDVVVAGALDVGSGGLINVRHFTIQAGGVVNGASGSIRVAGDFSNAGTFDAGAGTVWFEDGCGLGSATVSGSTTFYDSRFDSSSGKTYRIAAGSVQTFQHLLEIRGVSGTPIQLRSTSAGDDARFDLKASGTQSIADVGVCDNIAIGQWLAAGQANAAACSGAQRWFGTAGATRREIPTLVDAALAVLALLLGAHAAHALRRRTPSRGRERRGGR